MSSDHITLLTDGSFIYQSRYHILCTYRNSALDGQYSQTPPQNTHARTIEVSLALVSYLETVFSSLIYLLTYLRSDDGHGRVSAA